jgi:dipeptide/tripeptide permease
MWTTFFRDGGWGMYPTTLFGFLLVASGVLCLLRPERRFVPLALCLAALTLSSGLLGTATGVVNSFRYLERVPEVDQRFTIAALGCAESLNNLVLALILVTLTGVLGAAASLRSALKAPAAPASA